MRRGNCQLERDHGTVTTVPACDAISFTSLARTFGASGTGAHCSSLLNFRNSARSPPSSVTHSFSKQRRKTQPSGVSKEKKSGLRRRLLRFSYFFSSASEY